MIEVIQWGLVDYRQALRQQEELVAKVASGEHPDAIVLCSHPPVVTIGRVTPKEDYSAWTGELVEVSRGGRATYHGPNQIVAYPIISLDRDRLSLPKRDLHAYLTALGTAVVDTLSEFGIEGVYKSGEDPMGSKRHLTGVWVGQRKIASLGVAARKWVTFHGLALQFSQSDKISSGIQPCGFSPEVMTNMEELLGPAVSRDLVERTLVRHLLREIAQLPKVGS